MFLTDANCKVLIESEVVPLLTYLLQKDPLDDVRCAASQFTHFHCCLIYTSPVVVDIIYPIISPPSSSTILVVLNCYNLLINTC